MARASTLTRLPLERFFRLLGVHPLHANGVYLEPPTVCASPWLQYPWQQADRVGREDVAYAIAEAEATIEKYLGYRLLPSWEVDEWQPTVRPYKKELFNLNVNDIRGMRQVAFLDWGHLISGGVEAKTLITAGAAVTYSDANADGYAETATITVTTTALACEVAVYFPGEGGADEWEVKPITVTKVGNVATIVCRREQLVNPALWEALNPTDTGIIGTVDANFLTTVDVYRHYNNPQTQVSFLWEPYGNDCETCSGNGCTACAYSTSTGCLVIRNNPRLSIVSYHCADWNATTLQFDHSSWAVDREPDLARMYYYAGYRDKRLTCPTRQMAPELERLVAYYAAALLERPICECDNIHAWIEHWRRDLAIAGEEGLRISDNDLDNPFGTKRGQVYAWHYVKRMALGQAVRI